MNDVELSKRSAENLEATYFAIGSATPNARIERREGYSMCLGQLDHPIGNFAIVNKLGPAVAPELAAAAKQRVSFNVYVPDRESRPQTARQFHAAGFRRSYKLIQMSAVPTLSESDCSLQQVTADEERQRLATFMTTQFFTRQKAMVREQISRATAASSLSLYEIFRNGMACGAVMISREGGLYGIYNLCIESTRRRQGYGSDAVKNLLSHAAQTDTLAILQAEPSLAPWYFHLGFRETGVVDVFALGS